MRTVREEIERAKLYAEELKGVADRNQIAADAAGDETDWWMYRGQSHAYNVMIQQFDALLKETDPVALESVARP